MGWRSRQFAMKPIMNQLDFVNNLALFAQRPGTQIDWIFIFEVIGGIVGAIVIGALIYKVKNSEGAVPMNQAASDVIGGYRLKNLMNTGQTSQVWQVVETASGRHFAMKFLLPEKTHDGDFRQLLFHEAEVGIKLAHPNVIRIVKLAKDPHNPYFVMEYFPGGSLQRRIMHKGDAENKEFIRAKALDILKQAATALAYMNAFGWVHRDVKPDNLMVNSAGEVKLIDFALAVRVTKKGMFGKKKRQNKPAGTRSYMSPEQIRGEWLDGRADVYSFGATCYEVVTGRPPFRAASPQDLLHKQIVEKPVTPQFHNPEVTDQFAALVMRMLGKKREERPKDFHEVLMELRTLQIFKPTAAPKSA